MNATDLPVSFEGLPSRSGPLTWSQSLLWGKISAFREFGYRMNMQSVRTVPAGRTTEQIVERLGELMTRNESLRTRYAAGSEGPRQVVIPSGRLGVSIVEVPTLDEADDAAARTCAALWERPFADADLPLRVALIWHEGLPVRLVLVCSHLSVDQWSFEMVMDSLIGATDGPVGPATHPLDQVAYEMSAAGRRDLTRAIDHWRHELTRAADGASPAAEQAGPADHRPRLRVAKFSSAGALAACRLLAVEHRVSVSHVLLAAIACARAIPQGQRTAVLQITTANRITAADWREISCRTGAAVAVVDVARERFGQIIAESSQQGLLAVRYGMADPADIQRLVNETISTNDDATDPFIHVNFHGDFYNAGVNHSAWRRAVLDADPAACRFTWDESLDWNITQFYVHSATLDAALHIELHVDPGIVPGVGVMEFFDRLRRLLLAAAQGVDDMDHLIRMAQLQGDRPRKPPSSRGESRPRPSQIRT